MFLMEIKMKYFADITKVIYLKYCGQKLCQMYLIKVRASLSVTRLSLVMAAVPTESRELQKLIKMKKLVSGEIEND